VAYLLDQEIDSVVELYSVPILGGAREKFNGDLFTDGHVKEFSISSNGSRVVYRARQGDEPVYELYSVPTVGGERVKFFALFLN
jgi:hypothetical protein